MVCHNIPESLRRHIQFRPSLISWIHYVIQTLGEVNPWDFSRKTYWETQTFQTSGLEVSVGTAISRKWHTRIKLPVFYNGLISFTTKGFPPLHDDSKACSMKAKMKWNPLQTADTVDHTSKSQSSASLQGFVKGEKSLSFNRLYLNRLVGLTSPDTGFEIGQNLTPKKKKKVYRTIYPAAVRKKCLAVRLQRT